MNVIRQVVILCIVFAFVSRIAYALDIKEIQTMPSSDLVKILIKANTVTETSKMATEELWMRANSGRQDAVFWRAWYMHQMLAAIGVTGLVCAGTVYDDMKKVATDEKIQSLWEATAAMEQIGEMHEKGVCAQKSKYIATDWYIRAGNQYLANGDRDKALQMMEKALNLVPDHPQALKLRDALLR